MKTLSILHLFDNVRINNSFGTKNSTLDQFFVIFS